MKDIIVSAASHEVFDVKNKLKTTQYQFTKSKFRDKIKNVLNLFTLFADSPYLTALKNITFHEW